MTKLKNTKKGMAKKALSISLVAAMLATSNVPVWAAEDIFSDNSAVIEAEAPEEVPAEADAFTSENAAPAAIVQEEETNAPQLASSSTSDAYTVTQTFPGVQNNSVTWGTDVQADFKVTSKDGSAIPNNIHFQYAWKVDGYAAVSTGFAPGADISDTYKTLAADAGKSLTLYIYATDSSNNNKTVWSYTSDEISVKAINVSDMYTSATVGGTYTYNGGPQTVALTDITMSNNTTADQSPANFKVVQNGDHTNATEKAELTLVPQAAGYTGQITTSYKINPLVLDGTNHKISDNMEATLKTTSYVYTGKEIRVKKEDVAVIDKKTKEDLSNYLFADAAGYVSIGTASLKEVGNVSKLSLTMIIGVPQTGTKNYTITDDKGNHRLLATTNYASVSALNLANVNVAIRAKTYNGGKPVTLVKDDLEFTDSNGNELELFDQVDISVPSNATDIGSYTVTITAKSGNKNVTGSKAATLSIVGSDISAGTFANAPNNKLASKQYTGEQIAITKEDLGTLTIGGKAVSPQLYNLVNATNTDVKTGGKVTIEGLGDYKGSKMEVTFDIVPATVDSVKVTDTKVERIETTNPAAYKDAMKVVVTAKNAATPAKEFTLVDGKDFEVTYSFDTSNTVGENVKATIKLKNDNFTWGQAPVKEVTSEITGKVLKAENIKLKQTEFTYTGSAIEPEFDIVIDGKVINPSLFDYTYSNNLNAGTATLTVKGKTDDYSNTPVSVTYKINPADASKLKGVIGSKEYKGYSITVAPSDIDLTMAGKSIDVASNFALSFGENVKIGEGTVTLTPKNSNFTGTLVIKFQITGKMLDQGGDFTFYDENKVEVNNRVFNYDGTAHTFADEKFIYAGSDVLKEGTDYELKYVDNIYGAERFGNQIGAVLAIAKGEYGSNYTDGVALTDGVYKDAAGNTYSNVIAAGYFLINQQGVRRTNVSVSNGVYAGGLPVEPIVKVIVNGITLEEGKDYKLTYDNQARTDVTISNSLKVTVEPINGYRTGNNVNLEFNWGIDKFNLANADITVKGDDVIVKCGRVDVDASEYTVEKKDGKVTVTANKDSKNYTGTKTIDAETEDKKPSAPQIVDVKVSGNKATVILSGESEGATGYDYVISKDRNCITSKDYDKVNKNILSTSTTFTYTQQGTYYAYCHSWKRVNGKKVFSDWSNAYPFVVTSITPDQPVVTSVKVTGSTVKVTYTKSANATGYDIVLGTQVKKVNGEMRPVKYKVNGRNLVSKVTKGNTVTATFKNVPKGTYYAGLHAYNRTSESGTKVFSNWSNTKKAIVK